LFVPPRIGFDVPQRRAVLLWPRAVERVSCCETCCVYPTIRSIRDEIRMLSTAVELTKLTSTFLRADGQPYLLRTIAAGDGSFVRFKRPWLCPTQYW
jgi:hypothetical protein